MGKRGTEKASLAAHIIKLYPKIIRSEILKDKAFCDDIEVTAKTTVTFGDSKASFLREALMGAIREAYSSRTGTALVKSEEELDWEVCVESNPSIWITIKRQGLKLRCDTFWTLNPNKDERLLLFKEISTRYRLTSADINKWASVLSNELSDDEAAELMTDLTHTGTYHEQVLAHDIGKNGSNIKTLVPDNLTYYEKMVGKYSGSKNIIEYCEKELAEHYQDKEISYFDLLFCANSSISRAIAKRVTNSSLLDSLIQDAIQWLNPLMLVGCIEIALSIDAEVTETVLQQAFDCLISPETYEQTKLISSLFILVDGELSRLCLFKNKPSFYRRFAAFGQASLLAKVVREHGVYFKDIERLAMEQRGLSFFCQTFIDMRCEPRWQPLYSSAGQLRDEFYGRLNGALSVCNNTQFSEKLQQILVKERYISFNSFFSGPLEGNLEPNEIPAELRTSLEEKLKGEPTLEAFTALINLTNVCKIDTKYAEVAASLLEKTRHQIEGDVNKEVIYKILNGLATVAANLRSKKLAASVIILSRIYRDYLDINSSPEEIFAVGLVSAAAFENKDEWAEYIGQWAYEIACLELETNARGSLFSMLSQLCLLEPYLYYTCSKSLEILES